MHTLGALLLHGDLNQQARLTAVDARIVVLADRLVLVPQAALHRTRELYPRQPEQRNKKCPQLTGAAAKLAQDLSATGPVAWVETDYFGGAGEQAAIVWLKRREILAAWRASHGPINAALRALGVDRDAGKDEFDTVGLGRFRESSSWLSIAVPP